MSEHRSEGSERGAERTAGRSTESVAASEHRRESGDLPPGAIIAIDGPSGTGKSSVARGVAARLGAAYLDTGAMYRAATEAVLHASVDPADPAAVEAAVLAVRIVVDTDPSGEQVRVDDRDVTAPIRSAAVTAAVSAVSAVPAVRRVLVATQRELARDRAIVVEGRDIGTVVFPQAELKVYLTAAPEARAQRRATQLGVTDAVEIEAIAADLRRRDDLDSTRADSPLRPAEDAQPLDSSELSQDDVVEAIVSAWLQRTSEREPDSGRRTPTRGARQEYR